MATVTITLTDDDEGGVDVEVVFDESDGGTPAGELAARMLEVSADQLVEGSLHVEVIQ